MSQHAEAQWLRPHQVHNVTLVKINFHQDRRLPRNYSSQRGDAGVRRNGGNDAEQFRRNFLNWLKILPFFSSPAHFLRTWMVLAGFNWRRLFLNFLCVCMCVLRFPAEFVWLCVSCCLFWNCIAGAITELNSISVHSLSLILTAPDFAKLPSCCILNLYKDALTVSKREEGDV